MHTGANARHGLAGRRLIGQSGLTLGKARVSGHGGERAFPESGCTNPVQEPSVRPMHPVLDLGLLRNFQCVIHPNPKGYRTVCSSLL